MSSPNSPVPIYTAAGAAVPYTGLGTIASPWLTSLTLGTTYYAELGSDFCTTGVIQWVYDASIVITSITYASTALPREALATEGAAAGGWKTETLMTVITAAGGTAATQSTPVSGVGMKRLRAVIVVGATGGSLVGYQDWKEG